MEFLIFTDTLLFDQTLCFISSPYFQSNCMHTKCVHVHITSFIINIIQPFVAIIYQHHMCKCIITVEQQNSRQQRKYSLFRKTGKYKRQATSSFIFFFFSYLFIYISFLLLLFILSGLVCVSIIRCCLFQTYSD